MRSEEVNGMPDAGVEWRKERKGEIWERVELTPISVQHYLEELIELSKELSQGAAVDPTAIRRLGSTKNEERYLIREYYKRKGRATCECGRSVDESNECTRALLPVVFMAIYRCL